MRRSPRPTPSGFTLLEIMIVLVLIAILSGLAIPRMNLSTYRADGAMRVVQSILQQAERAAVQRQTNVVVGFDIEKQRIRVLYDANNDGVWNSGEEVRWRPLEDGNRFAVPPKTLAGGTATSGIVGSNLKTADGYPSVTYRRDGAASTPLEVYLRSSSKETDDFRALVVTQATGRVDVFRYGGGKWRKTR